MADHSRPWVTNGKRVWWVPFEWMRRAEVSFDQAKILYTDMARAGIWVPEMNMTAEERRRVEEGSHDDSRTEPDGPAARLVG